jgi:hypothetical protein
MLDLELIFEASDARFCTMRIGSAEVFSLLDHR